MPFDPIPVIGTGTSGTSAPEVVTIQGIAGGTPVPVSGTFTVELTGSGTNQGTPTSALSGAWPVIPTDGTYVVDVTSNDYTDTATGLVAGNTAVIINTTVVSPTAFIGFHGIGNG